MRFFAKKWANLSKSCLKIIPVQNKAKFFSTIHSPPLDETCIQAPMLWNFCHGQVSWAWNLPANKSRITNNKIANSFLLNTTEHEIFPANKYENANYCWHFHIYKQRTFSRPQWFSWMRIRLVISRLRVRPPPGRQHSFVEIDHEIFSMVILSLPLIQVGQLLVFWWKNVHNTD